MDSMIESTAFEDAVRARAYALWENEGRPLGRDAEHWRRSEQEFRRVATQPMQITQPLQVAQPLQASPVPAAKPEKIRGKKKVKKA